MASQLVSLGGWYFLPNLVTGYAQTAAYSIFIRAGDPKPAPGSQRYIRDRRRIHVAVIILYLLYTVYEADYQLRQQGDFYQLLGVPHNVDDRSLQSRFRRLTVQFHPDKATGSDKASIEAIYVRLKAARDTLVDPAKRFAYDRFGPDILRWQSCKTLPDYVYHGLQQLSVYYATSAIALIVLGLMGYLNNGMFWRYFVMGTLFVVEMYTITRPHFPVLLEKFINPFLITTGLRPPYLPFQMIILLRKIAVTFFIAMSQLGPLLQSASPGMEDPAVVSMQQIQRIEAVAAAVDTELSRLIAMEVIPFGNDEASVGELKEGLVDWLKVNTVRNDPEVRAAMARVLERRRAEGRDPGGERPAVGER
ncbi:unnamed protein product [Zymoseptoria tritici ST99CH_1A5]|uniref:J domain-containing protein n=2 Tax=Zymoseptoria tritici TaxID=1047171 RepID=F9X899_ZYMTI|nr:uncharacterized protein MYCGRDRAFT_109019 [Zymoseptoria tritici IPO323]EGP88487.1 hypothetical protein MYCGRDRAFT_109019 [Zymoseptoria tritici IPO323]SMY23420.1 unnamed protein product [Zymoseptoria tritici ST99CH_1A5]